MRRVVATFAALLLGALHASAQTVTRTIIAAPNGEPAALQGTIQGGVVPGVNAPGQPRDTRPQTGTARVRGRVTTDSGQPARRIAVRLNGATPRAVNTDTNGRFDFADLPSGRYTINIIRQGYVPASADAFDLAAGEQHDGVNIQLVRGGVITGQVVDEFGEPVIGASVVPMRSQFVQGQRRLVGIGASALSNDVGEYRLFGLASGAYYVSVTARNDAATITMVTTPGQPPVQSTSSSPDGYAPTYYPGTPDVAAAQRVTVAAGQTMANVNISLIATRLARISGIVVDAEGKPLTRGSVAMSSRAPGAPNTMNNGGPIRPDGSFVLPNVPPGTYSLRATIPPAGPPAPGPNGVPAPPQFAVGDVSVNGDDVGGVVLAPLRPATVRGRLVFDDAAAQQSLRAPAIRLSAQQLTLDVLMGGPPAPAHVNDDFSFEIPSMPGLVALRVALMGGGNGTTWRVKSVRARGAEVVDTGLELKPGEALDDVEIEMTRREQVVSGQVLDQRGQPAKQFSVVLFSQDPSRWVNPTNRYWAVAVPQPQGGYKMSSLPPGDYYAFATTGQQSVGEWSDPDFLETASRSAVRFSLHEGESITLDLKLPSR